jgi:flagellar biosynthetic protein FliQ
VNVGGILDLWREALSVAVTVAAPFLLVALAVGLVTSLMQAATQIQDNIMSFVPKLIAFALSLLLAGRFALDHLGQFTTTAIESTITMGQEGR